MRQMKIRYLRGNARIASICDAFSATPAGRHEEMNRLTHRRSLARPQRPILVETILMP